MLTKETEKRLRQIVRYSRHSSIDDAPAGHGPGTFAFAYWVNATGSKGVDCMAYVIGKRKLKLYVTTTGRSVKGQSILIAETSAPDAEAYAELAAGLEAAQERFEFYSFRDSWGHVHHRLQETAA